MMKTRVQHRKLMVGALAVLTGFGVFAEGEIQWTLYTGDGPFPDAPNVTIGWKSGGYTVNLTDADVTKLANLENLKMNADGATRLLIQNTTTPFVLKAKVTGTAGDIVFQNSAGVTITADNSDWGGHFEFDNSKVTVTDEHGLGGTGGAAVFTFRANSEIHFDKPGSNVFTNYCAISTDCDDNCRTMIFGSESTDKFFVQKGDFLQRHQNIARYLLFRNNFEIIEGKFPWNNFYGDNFFGGFVGDGEACLRIGADVELCFKRSLQLITGRGTVHFDTTVPVVGDYVNGGLTKDFGVNMYFHRSNILSSSTFALPYYQFYLRDTNVGVFDLCGTEQDIGVIKVTWGGGDVTTTSTGYTIVNSDEESGLLKVTGASGYYCPFDYNLPIRFTGHASFEMAADGNSIYLARQVSSSLGDLTVSAGTLGFRWDGGWTGTNVIVKGTGVLDVQSANAFTNGCQKLVVSENGKIVVGTSGIAKFGEVKLGDKTLEAGSYTVAALKADPDVARYVDGDDAATLEIRTEEEVWQGWPEDPGKVAVVPAGTTVYAHDADAAKVAALAGLQLRPNATVVFDNTETAVVLAAPVSGAGTIRIVDSVGVRLCGDNSGIISPGGFWITNSSVTVAHANGLGGAATERATVYYTPNGCLKFDCGDGVVTNNVAIDYSCLEDSRIYAVFGPESANGRLVQNADFICRTPGVNNGLWMFLTNNVEFAGGTFGMVGNSGLYTQLTAGARVTVSDGCTMEHVNGYNIWTVYFYGGLGEPAQLVFDPKSVEKIPQLGFSRIGVKFLRENVVPATSFLNFERFAPANDSGYAFDLNGQSQTLANLHGWGEGSYVIQKNKEDRLVVTSAVPATVTITDAAVYTNAVSFVDHAALTYDGDGTTVIVRGKSTTVGPLTVASGTLGFDWGATWQGTNIVVKSGATLKIGAESAEGFFGTAGELRAGKTMLSVENGGALEIESGVVRVYEAYFGGERVPRGEHAMSEFGWNGAGKLHVMHDLSGMSFYIK